MTKQKQKIISLLLLLLMTVVAVCGCGGTEAVSFAVFVRWRLKEKYETYK